MKKYFGPGYLLFGLMLVGLVACGDAATGVAGPGSGNPTPALANVTDNLTITAKPVVQPTVTVAAPTVVPATAPFTTAPVATPAVPAATPAPVVKAARLPDNGPDMIKLNRMVDDLQLEQEITPAKIGNNTFIVRLSRVGTEQAITNARLVRVNATMLDMDMGVAKLALKPLGPDQPGLYAGEDYLMSMYGKYRLDLLVQVPGQSDFTASFDASVTTS